MRKELEFSVRLPATVYLSEGMYVSCAPSLDLYSQGKTEGEARDNLREAIVLFVESCYRRGTLEAVLKDLGFSPAANKGQQHNNNDWMEVPLPLLAANAMNGSASNTAS